MTRESAAATRRRLLRPLLWDDDREDRYRARRLGLILMIASAVVMCILLGALWLTLRSFLP